MMKKIEIIQTADIHGTIRDYAYIAAYVNRLREQNASVLLVDCGDIFRGNILAEYSGGTIVATGTPEQVAQCEAGYTGQFLKPLLKC